MDISKLCQLVVGYDEEAIGPDQVAQLVGGSSSTPNGKGFDSRLGCIREATDS